MFNFKNIFSFAVLGICLSGMGYALDLKGTVPVSITSDTAANAKNIAFAEARRQIITDSLMKYANADQLSEAVLGAGDRDLLDLIASTGISGEQLSDTTYSANITMQLDIDIAKRWLDDSGVQNWLTNGVSGDSFVVIASMSDGVVNWMDLNRALRSENIPVSVRYMLGNQITLDVPVESRSEFTLTIRENAWRYNYQDGVLQIWK